MCVPPGQANLMHEVAACICAAVDADEFNLYIHETEGQITLFGPLNTGHSTPERSQQIKSGTTVAAHCAKVKDIIKSSNCSQDPRFPLGVPGLTGSYRVLCHPICSDQVTSTTRAPNEPVSRACAVR